MKRVIYDNVLVSRVKTETKQELLALEYFERSVTTLLAILLFFWHANSHLKPQELLNEVTQNTPTIYLVSFLVEVCQVTAFESNDVDL